MLIFCLYTGHTVCGLLGARPWRKRLRAQGEGSSPALLCLPAGPPPPHPFSPSTASCLPLREPCSPVEPVHPPLSHHPPATHPQARPADSRAPGTLCGDSAPLVPSGEPLSRPWYSLQEPPAPLVPRRPAFRRDRVRTDSGRCPPCPWYSLRELCPRGPGCCCCCCCFCCCRRRRRRRRRCCVCHRRTLVGSPPRPWYPCGREGGASAGPAPAADKSLDQGLTFNRSQRGSCSATYETLTQNQVVCK